jgi:hypothetical protein
MNDKDLDAFNEWRNSTSTRLDIHDAWQAACEYKDKEIELLNNEISWLEEQIDDFMDEPDITIKKLQAENKKLREALELTIKTAEYVYQPDKPLEKGLPPFHYHTLTYEGDLELIEKTIAARKLLDSTKE